MTSTSHVWTQKWQSIQNQLISPCIVLDIDTIASALGGLSPQGSAYRFSAMWDTGATHSVISNNVVETMGLKQEGFIPIVHVNGEDIAPVYHVVLGLPNGVGFPMLNIAGTALTGFDVLIGMDIINRGDFAVTNKNGKTMFSYRYPSMTEINFRSELESTDGDAT